MILVILSNCYIDNLDKIEKDIQYRDRQDMGRSHGPLKKAEDALEIDTTRLTIEQQVYLILKLAKEKISGS